MKKLVLNICFDTGIDSLVVDTTNIRLKILADLFYAFKAAM